MFKKILWILGIILFILALFGVSYYLVKESGLFAVANPSIKCSNSECCQNAGYDYFNPSLNSCYSEGDLDYSSSGGGAESGS